MAESVILVCDVCGSPAQESVAMKVGARSLTKDLCGIHLKELVSGARPPKRGRRPRRALLPVATPIGRGRPTRRKRASISKARPKTATPKNRITDPVVLEKRRAALAKARKALAKKRAAAKRAS